MENSRKMNISKANTRSLLSFSLSLECQIVKIKRTNENSPSTELLQLTNSVCPVQFLSSQYLLLIVYLPSLAFISRQDIAGNSGMEPRGTAKLKLSMRSNFVAMARSVSCHRLRNVSP